MKRAVLPLFAAFVLTSCSSVMPERTGTPEMLNRINITTPAVTGAKCVFKTADYSYTVTTPGTLQAMPSNIDITYTCQHKGFKTARGVIEAKADRWTMTHMANTVLIGERFDLKDGEKWSYPKSVDIEMIPDTGVAVAHQDIMDRTGTATRQQLDREFQMMLDETSWALHGGTPPAGQNSQLPPVQNVQTVQPVKTAPANATPQAGDAPQPLNLAR